MDQNQAQSHVEELAKFKSNLEEFLKTYSADIEAQMLSELRKPQIDVLSVYRKQGMLLLCDRLAGEYESFAKRALEQANYEAVYKV